MCYSVLLALVLRVATIRTKWTNRKNNTNQEPNVRERSLMGRLNRSCLCDWEAIRRKMCLIGPPQDGGGGSEV